MDPSKLIRNPVYVRAQRQELPDGSVVMKKGCKIYVPTRFAERNLAQVGLETHIVGIYAIVVEDKYYAVSLVNAFVPIKPSSINKVLIYGVENYEFVFDPGATVIISLDLVQRDKVAFSIYDEYMSKGNVPWYLNYDDMGRLFGTARKHAGASTGDNFTVTETINSLIARDPQDRTLYYRQTIKSRQELQTRPPAYIPLKGVMYLSNTINKVAGSFFGTAVTSALVYPTERVEPIEKLLRA